MLLQAKNIPECQVYFRIIEPPQTPPRRRGKKNREMLRICSKLAPFRLSLMPYPSTLYAIVSAIKLRAPTEHADILRIEDAFGYVTLTRHAIDLVSASKCIQNLLDAQGSTNSL